MFSPKPLQSVPLKLCGFTYFSSQKKHNTLDLLSSISAADSLLVTQLLGNLLNLLGGESSALVNVQLEYEVLLEY